MPILHIENTGKNRHFCIANLKPKEILVAFSGDTLLYQSQGSGYRQIQAMAECEDDVTWVIINA